MTLFTYKKKNNNNNLFIYQVYLRRTIARMDQRKDGPHNTISQMATLEN